MMSYNDALKALAKYRTDEVVIATMGAMMLWPYISDSEYDFVYFDAMGSGGALALGLALAQPSRRVIVLEGDGSLVMNLGVLALIADVAPPNMILFVCNNGQYSQTGGQAIPGAGKLDFPAIAKGCGFLRIHSFGDLPSFEDKLPVLLKERGPVFVDLRVRATTKAKDFFERRLDPQMTRVRGEAAWNALRTTLLKGIPA